MIIAIVGIVHKSNLLPYYLQHYRYLGVQKFFVSCDPDKLDPSGALKEFILRQKDIELIQLPSGFRRSQLCGGIEEEIRKTVATSDDWVIPSDLDEFNQYPVTLPEFVHKLQSGFFTHMSGHLSDRISVSGELNGLLPIEDGVSIWKQYPLVGQVTALLSRGRTDKVLISRGDLAWGMGHHQMRDADNLNPYPELGVSHHFKWIGGLEQRLGWRIDNEQRVRLPWSEESLRLVNYFQQHGRVIHEHVAAIEGWHP